MPIKINDSGQTKSLGSGFQPAVEKKNSSFSNILADTRKLDKEELQIFLARLEKQGQKLAESMSWQDLREFKLMIRRFLKSTLGQYGQMQEESFWDYHGQPKVLARVTKINHALEELGKEILASQAEPLKVLAKINEIKGLIIDLFA
jgi:uncharacterized protein YaaR (DUF327 family)